MRYTFFLLDGAHLLHAFQLKWRIQITVHLRDLRVKIFESPAMQVINDLVTLVAQQFVEIVARFGSQLAQVKFLILHLDNIV